MLLILLMSAMLQVAGDPVLTLLVQMFERINPAAAENAYFPAYAKTRILWIYEQQKRGILDITLLANIANTELGPDALMAAGSDGKRLFLVVPRKRFQQFLTEESSTPLRMKNNFMLAVVHEVVHLQLGKLSTANHVDEEMRAWREVSINAVRPLRALFQPMAPRFIAVDDALMSCKDRLPCEPFRRILFGR